MSLYERSNRLGGQWNVLSAYRPEQTGLAKFLSRGLEKAGVKVSLGKEVTQEMAEKMRPDAVIIATGASPKTLDDVPGIRRKNVVLAHDVLTGKAETGKDVVVIGGHMVGLDAALMLAEKGKAVTVVEKYKIAWGVLHNLKLAMLEQLIKHRVVMFPDSTLESVTDNGVNIIWDGGEPEKKGGARYEILFLKADTVVIAVGSRSEATLADQLQVLMPEVYSIGDCVEPRNVLAAIHEASEVARKI